MSLIGALNTSSLAMLAQSQGMQTVSTNIANVNTTAYKREDTLFQTLLYAQRGNTVASERVAVKPVDRREVMGQGFILATGRADDLAVNGNGFFMVSSSFEQNGKTETMFTRDGSLTQKYVDMGDGTQQSFYLAGSGQYLLGWKANDDGTFTTSPAGAGLVPVRSNSLDEIDGTATTEALLAGNVDAGTQIGSSVSLQGTVYDQSWTARSLNYGWTKTGSNNWNLDFQVSGGTVDTPVAGGTPIVFNGNGQLQSPAGPVSIGVTWDDGTNGTINIDLSEMQQYADATQVRRTTQNGNEAGRLYDESFDSNGVLWGSYTNGRNRPLYKLGMANFVAPNSLEAVSGNLFRATQEAGKMTVKDLENEGDGTSIEVGSLESSNVDMADEFTKMMIVQKAYSMASTNFRTVDEMMELTATLKR